MLKKLIKMEWSESSLTIRPIFLKWSKIKAEIDMAASSEKTPIAMC